MPVLGVQRYRAVPADQARDELDPISERIVHVPAANAGLIGPLR